jgi:GNAT superfamily N-acetyltransferase
MTLKLTACRALLEQDPARYIDMTQPLVRGTGRILEDAPDGALVQVNTQDGGTLYTVCAADESAARRLVARIPQAPTYVTCHEEASFPALRAAFGYDKMRPCRQVAYLGEDPLTEPELPFTLRKLTLDFLPQVQAHYDLAGEDYLTGILNRGELLGAFDGENNLAGFIGKHVEGTMGLLEVFPAYRRRGLATLLQTHLANQERERGHIPYAQVFSDNEVSLLLQRSLGFTCSAGYLYWPAD